MSTTDEQRVQFSDWFHKTFASPPMEFYPFAEAAWYAGQSAFAQQAPTPAVPEPPSVHQALLDSLSALLDEQRELPTNKRISLDYRESIEAAINKLAKLPRIKS